MPKRIPIALFSFALAASVLFAAEPESVNRKEMRKIMSGLTAPYSVDRIEAIKEVGGLTDRELVAENKIPELLADIARGKGRPRSKTERIAALQSLMNLSLNSVVDPRMILDHMRRIIEDDEEKVEVRIRALGLLAEVGNIQIDTRINDQVELVRQTYALVIETTRPKMRRPNALRAAALKALGSMSASAALTDRMREEANTTLLEAMRERRSGMIRSAGMTGLLSFIEVTGSDDSRLLSDIIRAVTDKDADLEMRKRGIEAVEKMLVNGARLARRKDLLEFLYNRISAGDDDELVIASRCLLRLNEAEEIHTILNVFLAQLKKQHKLYAQKALVKSVAELMHPLAMILDNPRASSRDKATALQDAKNLVGFLAQLVEAEQLPEELHLTAIRSVGMTPDVFSRQRIFEGLLKILKAQTKDGETNELGNEALWAMETIAGVKMRAMDGGAVDVGRWEQWYEENKAYLAPGKTPLLREEE